jgi:hypothetical protein
MLPSEYILISRLSKAGFRSLLLQGFMAFRVEGQDEGSKISCLFVFIYPLTPSLLPEGEGVIQ